MKTFLEFMELDEVMSAAGRRKLSRRMKTNRAKLAIARKRAMRKRSASSAVVAKRANQRVRRAMAKKMSGGKSTSKLSVSQRIAISKRLAQRRRQLSMQANRAKIAVRRDLRK